MRNGHWLPWARRRARLGRDAALNVFAPRLLGQAYTIGTTWYFDRSKL